ncbi:immunity protein Imm33 domain-containing protein [Flavobacterium wongokense]|uniref:immunity protein Imm33 domain-containing protein n=1 Tax=Flavobacterium wongokense TaxID=2910674 RepID=UPI001F484F98|nr:hypothetical protein [Flavobacterium sp. WG47]MCF6133563.1 hypothetical protein [Flavobacterium sp. WG47]
MNDWNSYLEEQKKICKEYDSLWKPINKDLKVGISTDLNLEPLNGLRHNSEDGTTGWFIWSGEYEEREDFFKPICAEHLIEKKPEVIKYLGLDVGFRFLLGKENYEDVWFDKKISEI